MEPYRYHCVLGFLVDPEARADQEGIHHLHHHCQQTDLMNLWGREVQEGRWVREAQEDLE